MSRDRPLRAVLVTLAVLVVVALAWFGFRAWQVAGALSDVRTAGERMRTALVEGDQEEVATELAALRTSSRDAAELTGGPTWRVAGFAPFVGDDLAAVGRAAAVVDDLARDGLEPLAATLDDLDALIPQEGRVSPSAVAALREPVATAAEAFRRADEALSARHDGEFIGRVEDAYGELASGVSDAASVLRSADTAVTVLPEMLGADAAQDFLLVVQNNAEIRATGGLPGATTLLNVTDGRIRIQRQVAANSYGELAEPVLPLTPAELAIYDRQLGTYFQDANFTPDFPRAAELWRARWEETYPEDLDGILSLDPVALSYLLEVTGPVRVAGRQLTGDNVVDELLHRVYLRVEEPEQQDVFFGRAARAIFDRVSSGVESPRRLIDALVRATGEGRLYVHSFEPALQAELAGSAVAGELPTAGSDVPHVGVYLNDASGSKMSYFLRYDARVAATYCRSGVQGVSGALTMRSTAPPDAASLPFYVTAGGSFGTEPGWQSIFVRLYGPVGGRITEVRLQDEPVEDLDVVAHDGRPVATLAVAIPPQKVVDVEWRMVSGPEQAGDVRLEVTPSIEAGRPAATRSGSACG